MDAKLTELLDSVRYYADADDYLIALECVELLAKEVKDRIAMQDEITLRAAAAKGLNVFRKKRSKDECPPKK